jgi:predicted nucleic acid-binding Zn finger protein
MIIAQPQPTTATRNAIATRMNRALSSASRYTFIALRGRLHFRVEGGTTTYEVHQGGHCTCPDFLERGSQRGYACKHLLLLASGLAQVRAETDAEYATRHAQELAGIERARRSIADLFPDD